MDTHWLNEDEMEAMKSPDNIETFISSEIIRRKGKWYHFDLNFEVMHGPHDTYEECESVCRRYAIEKMSVVVDIELS